MRKVKVIGGNADVDTGTEDIWLPGGSYAFPAAAAATTIVSSSVNDTAAGTGARTVRVEGLSSTFDEKSETVSLNGTGAVTLTNSYLRINNVYVLTAGSGLVNAGTVDVKHSSTVLSRIAVGENRARQAIFTPSSSLSQWAIVKLYAAAVNAVAGTVAVKVWTKKTAGLWQLRDVVAVYGTIMPFTEVKYETPIYVDQGEDIRLEATSTADNTSVAAGFDIWSAVT